MTENTAIAWTIVREFPDYAYDPKTYRKIKITGLLETISIDKFQATFQIADYICDNYGGGNYRIYSENAHGEYLSSRPIEIPMFYDPLDGDGNKFLLDLGEKLREIENSNTNIMSKLELEYMRVRNEFDKETQALKVAHDLELREMRDTFLREKEILRDNFSREKEILKEMYENKLRDLRQELGR